jgi:flagellar hook-associated protein 2
VAKDIVGVKATVDSFVKAFNDLGKIFSDLTKFDATSKKASLLTGDATVRGIQGQLRAVLNQALASAGGGLSTLADIGVAFQSDGTLKVDAAKLDKVLADPTKDISTLFAAIGKPSDSLVTFVASTDDTQAGTYPLTVTQLATQGKAAGNAAAGLTIAAGGNDTLDISVDGVAVSVTLAAGTYTAAALASELQSKINGAVSLSSAGIAVAVTESSGVLTVTSEKFGSASKVTIDGGNAAAGLFGIVTATDGRDIAGTLGGQAATGSGQKLTATSGDAKGLSVSVMGGAAGERGQVEFAKGFAVQLDKLVSRLLENDGTVDSRLDGINTSVRDIGKRREALEARMIQIERRLRAQFTALDTLIASMTKTSSFLQQQLANLPKTSNQGDN